MDEGKVIARSDVSVALTPSVREWLVSRAHGRVVVIDYLATRRCGVAIGDLTVSVRREEPRPPYVELTPIDGVRLFAERRLLGILRDAEPSLVLRGPPFARHVSISLGRPELWIDFLECPGITHGKGPIRLTRR